MDIETCDHGQEVGHWCRTCGTVESKAKSDAKIVIPPGGPYPYYEKKDDPKDKPTAANPINYGRWMP